MIPESIDPVAVIGGGIAGAVACLRLKALGLDPIWITPGGAAGDKPGEHLNPAARPLLARVNAVHLLDRDCHRQANAMFSAWGSEQIVERNAIVHLEGPGTVLGRAAFEADLRDAAIGRGVRIVDGVVEAVTRSEDHWCLAASGQDHRARLVIDASGRTAIVARGRGQRFRADQLAALVAYPVQDPASDVEPTRATLIESVAGGWWYASLLADGRLALNFYTDPDLLPRDATRDPSAFATLLKDTLYIGRWIDDAGFRLLAAPGLVSAGSTWMAPAAGPGWVAVGDAAAAFDPLSSHGMTTALWTAIAAAEAVPAALAGDESALKTYVAKVADGVQEYLVARARIYAAERRFADRPFWRRRL